MANVFRMFLFSPIAVVYGFIIWMRNQLFDFKILKQKEFSAPVVVIGNLEMGGSGKTPMSDYLIDKLNHSCEIAYISRGYKRKSNGFVLATNQSGLYDLGDEAYMIFKKWGEKIVLAVDSDRRRAISKILEAHPEINLILLDDAMQHRWVKPRVIIQLSTFYKPFFNNYLFPIGTLRDFAMEFKRSDFLIFTKSPSADQENLDKISAEMFASGLFHPFIFVSDIQYLKPVNCNGKTLTEGEKVVAISGLAKNEIFFQQVKNEFSVLKYISKPDHYRYLPGFFEMENIAEANIICPEKDFYKLIAIAPKPERIYYLPISIQIFPEQKFISQLDEAIRN